MTLRMKFVATLLSVAAISTAAGAQTFSFARTGSLSSTTHELLSSVNVNFAMPVSTVEATKGTGNDLIAESMPTANFGTVSLHESDANADGEEKSNEERGFFSTNTGRASLIGIVGLAGAGYVAFNGGSNSSPAVENVSLPATAAAFAGPAAVIVNPEPATMALMGLGLGALGIAVRRRRTS
jgi:hypothetical protein